MLEMSNHHPEIDLSEVHELPHQEVNLCGIHHDEEWILDIGGGGEGIIGSLEGRQVVAIDRVSDELLDTRNEALKLVMDARQLNFLENSFGTATLFFTLMYIPLDDLSSVFGEISRVLKPGGELLIWDVNVELPSDIEEKKYFLVPLTVVFPDGRRRTTGYGAAIRDQNMDSFIVEAQKHGFEAIEQVTSGLTFFVRMALRK
ncbi:MAG: class I SAM-dependent methyltransferase [Candidatus Thorarchaeota archaeon]|nr:class I SAM-dependent methyltransferase [Candidatus Thorarchaeota archaeon]